MILPSRPQRSTKPPRLNAMTLSSLDPIMDSYGLDARDFDRRVPWSVKIWSAPCSRFQTRYALLSPVNNKAPMREKTGSQSRIQTRLQRHRPRRRHNLADPRVNALHDIAMLSAVQESERGTPSIWLYYLWVFLFVFPDRPPWIAGIE